jgi:hypothetical protein
LVFLILDSDTDSMPRRRNFWKHLKRQQQRWLLGSAGPASDIRMIDPRTGQVLRTIPCCTFPPARSSYSCAYPPPALPLTEFQPPYVFTKQLRL